MLSHDSESNSITMPFFLACKPCISTLLEQNPTQSGGQSLWRTHNLFELFLTLVFFLEEYIAYVYWKNHLNEFDSLNGGGGKKEVES